MPKKLTFILGGARSGKSRHAQSLATERNHSVLYVATAEAGDEDMAARIANHRAERPAHWLTLEAPHGVGPAVQNYVSRLILRQAQDKLFHASPPGVILVDCLTLLASNVIVPLPEPVTEASATAALNAEVDELLTAYHTLQAEWIVVSNEVGLGIVPEYALSRAYRDALGRANQRLAAAADEVLLMVAGLPLRVKG